MAIRDHTWPYVTPRESRKMFLPAVELYF